MDYNVMFFFIGIPVGCTIGYLWHVKKLAEEIFRRQKAEKRLKEIKMGKAKREVVCEDCGSREFSVYNENLLSCDDCGQIFNTEEKQNKEIVKNGQSSRLA